MKTNSATNAQIAASDAKSSTWLTANAGSGKTKNEIDNDLQGTTKIWEEIKDLSLIHI
mgnify:CR=1 FL=1